MNTTTHGAHTYTHTVQSAAEVAVSIEGQEELDMAALMGFSGFGKSKPKAAEAEDRDKAFANLRAAPTAPASVVAADSDGSTENASRRSTSRTTAAVADFEEEDGAGQGEKEGEDESESGSGSGSEVEDEVLFSLFLPPSPAYKLHPFHTPSPAPRPFSSPPSAATLNDIRVLGPC